MQRVCPIVQVGGMHAPPTQSAAVAHAEPEFWKPVRSALQIWGWAPLHCVSPVAQTGVVHVPVAALQRPAVTQVMPRS